jgi:amino acid transporter
VFGEYILVAARLQPTRWASRGIGAACLTFSLLLHGTALRWGLRLQNALGIFKVGILVFIAVSGWVALGGHLKVEKPHNFTNAFNGTTANASSFCLSLYNVSGSLYY